MNHEGGHDFKPKDKIQATLFTQNTVMNAPPKVAPKGIEENFGNQEFIDVDDPIK